MTGVGCFVNAAEPGPELAQARKSVRSITHVIAAPELTPRTWSRPLVITAVVRVQQQ